MREEALCVDLALFLMTYLPNCSLAFQSPAGRGRNCLIDLEADSGPERAGAGAPSLLHRDLAALGERGAGRKAPRSRRASSPLGETPVSRGSTVRGVQTAPLHSVPALQWVMTSGDSLHLGFPGVPERRAWAGAGRSQVQSLVCLSPFLPYRDQ